MKTEKQFIDNIKTNSGSTMVEYYKDIKYICECGTPTNSLMKFMSMKYNQPEFITEYFFTKAKSFI